MRTVAFPVRGGALGDPVPHRPALELRGAVATHDEGHRERARDRQVRLSVIMDAAVGNGDAVGITRQAMSGTLTYR